MGRVLLIHGYGEHCYRPQYNKLAKDVSALGWEVHRHTIKGHWDGSEAQPDYYFDSFAQILSQLREHVERLQSAEPLVLLGHSLGGLLTIRLLQEHPSLVSAGIALSPAIEIGPKYDTPCKRFIAYLLVDYLNCPKASNPWDILDPGDVALNHADYVKDPNILGKGVCAGIAVTCRNESILAREQCAKLKKPLLIIHGGEDKIALASSSRIFATMAPDHVNCHVYPDARHDLLADKEDIRQSLISKIADFLDMRILETRRALKKDDIESD